MRGCEVGFSITGAGLSMLNNVTFINNTLGVLVSSPANLYLARSSFSNNSPALSSISSTLTITNTEFSNNYVRGSLSSAIVVRGGKMDITDCTFNQNKGNEGGAINTVNSIVTITRSFSSSNIASSNGGFASFASSNVTIIESSFDSNNAIKGGGALSLQGGSIIDYDGRYYNNNCGGSGGAILLDSVSSKFTLSKFGANKGIDGGGAIVITSPLSSTFNNCTFNNNTCGTLEYGGAIKMNCSSENRIAEITNSIFNGNTASSGGAIYSYYCGAFLTHSLFTRNRAIATLTNARGGVLFGVGSNISSFSCAFSFNEAQSGGAFYVGCVLFLLHYITHSFSSQSDNL